MRDFEHHYQNDRPAELHSLLKLTQDSSDVRKLPMRIPKRARLTTPRPEVIR